MGTRVYEYQGKEFELDDSIPVADAVNKIKDVYSKLPDTVKAPTKEVGFWDSIGRGVDEAKYGLKQVGNMADAAIQDVLGNLLPGDDRARQEDAFKRMEAAKAAHDAQLASRVGEHQPLVNKGVQAIVGGLPQMLTTHGATAMEDAMNGAPLDKNYAGLALDTALQAANILLPAGKGVVKGAVAGAGSNVATDVTSDEVKKKLYKDTKAATPYSSKTVEDYLLSAALGGVTGAAIGHFTKGDTANTKYDPKADSAKLEALTPKAKELVSPDAPKMSPEQLEAYYSELKAQRESNAKAKSIMDQEYAAKLAAEEKLKKDTIAANDLYRQQRQAQEQATAQDVTIPDEIRAQKAQEAEVMQRNQAFLEEAAAKRAEADQLRAQQEAQDAIISKQKEQAAAEAEGINRDAEAARLSYTNSLLQKTLADTPKVSNQYPSYYSKEVTPAPKSLAIPKGQRGGIDFKSIFEAFGNKKSSDINEDLPGGLGDKIGSMLKPMPNTEKALAEIKEAGVNSSVTATDLRPGASYTALRYADPLIKTAANFVQWAHTAATTAIESNVKPIESSLRKLRMASKQEFVELGSLFKKEMFSESVYTPEELKAVGYTDRQIKLHQELRENFKKTYEAQNEVLKSKGLKELTQLDYYMVSARSGDWTATIKDSKGRIAWFLRENSKSDIESAIKYLKAQNLDLDFAGVKPEAKPLANGVAGSDPYASFSSMLLRVGDDPTVQAIHKALLAREEATSVRQLGQNKHFLEKHNIRGFAGDRPWVDRYKDTLDMFDKQVQYSKNAYEWSYMQRAHSELSKIMSDPDVLKASPDSVEYATKYLDHAMGMGDNLAISNFEKYLANKAGFSGRQLREGAQIAKATWVAQKMVANLGNAIQQLWQPVDTIERHMRLSDAGYSHNPFKTMVLGSLDTTAGLAKHYGQKIGAPTESIKMTPLGELAFKYAEDNHILSMSMYDENVDIRTSKTAEAINQLGIIQKETNKIANYSGFMSFVHHLDQSGKYTDKMELLRDAEHNMLASMVDPRPQERPFLQQDLGSVGIMGGALQSYFVNMANRLADAAADAKAGKPKYLLTLLAANTAMAGVTGSIAFNAASAACDAWNDFLAGYAPTWYNDLHVRDLGLQIGDGIGEVFGSGRVGEAISRGIPTVTTGVISEATGGAGKSMDLSSRFEFTPSIPVIGMGADIIKQGMGVAAGVANGSPMQTAAAVAPAGWIKGMIENSDEFNLPSGKSVTPTNPKAEYGVMRDDTDKLYKAIGISSRAETKQREGMWEKSQQDRRTQKVVESLSDRIVRDLVRKGTIDQTELAALIKTAPDEAKAKLLQKYERELMNSNLSGEALAWQRSQKLRKLESTIDVYASKQQRP